MLCSVMARDDHLVKTCSSIFKKYPSARSVMEDKNAIDELQARVCTIFATTKSRFIWEAARDIESKFGGKVPSTFAELLQFTGVGQKIANMMLSVAFDIQHGVAIDRHAR